MKTSRFIYFTIFVFVLNAGAQAQHRLMMSVNYSVNVPTGSFADFIENTSFRGWNASVSYRLNQRISLGATTGFQDFYRKTDRQVYKDAEGRDISAVITHSIQTIPFLATVQYGLSPEKRVQPYAALGAGASLVTRSRYLGQFADNDSKVKLAARPEVGLFIPIKKESEGGINIATAFNFIPYNEDELKNLNSFAITVGAKFPLR
jgi:opacity protein-like surface antigen